MPSFIELYKDQKTGKSSDKWSFYIPQYDRIFLPFAEKPVRVLSIGIQNCGDLEIYTKYFRRGKVFVGCDINEACSNAKFDDKRVNIVIGDVNEKETTSKIAYISSEFDIIIDDGSHKSSDIVKTFMLYFHYLSNDGVFVIEDLHCSYWEFYEGGIYNNLSSMNFFKDLVDIVNFESFGIEAKRSDLLDRFSEKYGVFLEEDMLASIHSIKFVNSMCIVEKRAPEFNLLGPRMIVGSQEPAVAGMLSLNGNPLEVPDQSNNYWSKLDQSPHKMEKNLLQAAKYERRFSELKKKFTKLANENKVNEIKAAQLEARLAQTQHAFKAVAHELEMGRRRPHKLLKTLIVYRVFRMLSKLAPVLPEKRASWIRWIIETRNPGRPIPLTGVNFGAYALPAPSRDCIIVFSHEASRTGAPVVSLNIIEQLSEKYDVVSVLLSEGAIVTSFREKSFFNIELNQGAMTHAEIEQRVLEILAKMKPKYAVVNSVASYKAMSALKKAGVPSVALVHEFAAYIPVHPYFAEVIDKANRVVFSTELTLETLVRLEHMCRPLKASILPQGKSVAPSMETSAEVLEQEDKLIKKVFPAVEDEIVLVGLGSVNVRKGVDVFLEVARVLRFKNLKQRYRFVWVGDGFSTVDNEYSRFLSDQVQRSGLVGMVHFLPAVCSIEKVYGAADALILASRLDPLPNVAIDMIAHSKPVFCFDKTTGFAEIMQANGFEDCVADYFSATDMADKIAQTLPNKDAAQALGSAQNAKLSHLFNMKDYIATIDSLALSALDDEAVLRSDIQTIIDSCLFRRDFYELTPSGLTDLEVIEEYVSRCKSGRLARRALPGFHPFLYAELNNLPPARDPLAHYITAGMPSGLWKCNVIRETDRPHERHIESPRCALHIHAYYVGALEDILSRIEENANFPDLFISTRKGGRGSVEAIVSRYPGKVVSIREVPNIGRDIAPLITEFGREMSGYDLIGHVHTKQSLHVAERSVIGTWSNFILGNLLGSVGGPAMFDRILRAFSEDEELCLVFPEDPHIMGWTENRAVSVGIADALGMKAMPDNFNFPIGSMFWMRSDLFSRFVGLDLDWQDYPAEPLPIDGSILHALERLFGALPQVEGMKIAVTNVDGLCR